jgi:hypothetical protein
VPHERAEGIEERRKKGGKKGRCGAGECETRRRIRATEGVGREHKLGWSQRLPPRTVPKNASGSRMRSRPTRMWLRKGERIS